jgi:hypothetical protein
MQNAQTSLQAVKRQNPLANQFTSFLVNTYSQASQIGQDYLAKGEFVFIIERIETVVWHGFCAKFTSDCVGWQSIHVNFDIGANTFF